MSELKLFRLQGTTANIVPPEPLGLEKSLQEIIERNLETVLGVRFLATEYATSRSHSGRIDTLGLDEINSPTIIEYKRTSNENVINQGLFYLEWLLEHRADFKLLVMDKLGVSVASEIDWSNPRLICIAGDFSRYDEHAVRQIPRNIDLYRHRLFKPDLLALELVHRSSAPALPNDDLSAISHTPRVNPGSGPERLYAQAVVALDGTLRDLYEGLRSFILALGDDVQETPKKLWVTYRRTKIFASIVIRRSNIDLYLKLNPDTVSLEHGFSRDVRHLGHWGVGDLEISIDSIEDLHKAQILIQRSYEEI